MKLWDVTWDLWEQHNGFLHTCANQEILHNMANIDAEIQFQFCPGTAHLPWWAQYLFEGNVDALLGTLIHHWKKWLASVTAAQEMAANWQSQWGQEMVASQRLDTV